MKCAVHPEVDATGFCRNCGKPMCPACIRPVRDVFYCEDCLATVMGIPAPVPAAAVNPGVPSTAIPVLPPGVPGTLPPAAPGSHPNPGIAFLLGFVPGLGAIYNGEYNKAIIHILIFGGIILGITGGLGDNLEGFWILALNVFIVYMAIDALRTAKSRQTGQPVNDPFADWSKNRAMGPFILIGIGGLLLLHNFGFFDYFRVKEIFWPIVVIGIGVLMLRNRVGGKS
jgi:Domain of unknown function (DUF5668)/B-box zinc finger